MKEPDHKSRPSTSGLAVVSLVLGILSLLGLAPLLAIPAVLCGHTALSRLAEGSRQVRGRRMAKVGMLTGYTSVAVILAALPFLVTGPFAPGRSAVDLDAVAASRCIENLTIISLAKEEAMYDRSLADGAVITELDLLDYVPDAPDSLACPSAGVYNLNPVGTEPECSVAGHELSF